MRKFLSLLMCAASFSAFAGGLLTNTNQNVAFLRNPARDAAIGIDGVYSNPAGVIFLGDGLHLSLNIQSAHQTRTIETGYPLFVNNEHNSSPMHKFEGVADAPVIPSIQAAYNTGRWSFQFGFAITGGGGKCEFEDGLGSFEQVVSGLLAQNAASINGMYQQLSAANAQLAPYGFNVIPGVDDHAMGSKYSYDSYMRGRQYYFGFTLGAAYKINDNLSVYGGARVLYGSANYYGYVKNINIEHIENGHSTMVNASDHFSEQARDFYYAAGKLDGVSQALTQSGQAELGAQMGQVADGVMGAAQGAYAAAQKTQDIELNCDQSGVGVAPIIGVDYKVGNFNFAAKYEFKTRMRLKNKAANSESAAQIPMLQKYGDGNKVAEDTPALFTVGAQYSITPSIRVMAGWHHFFDVDTKQYTKAMLGDTNEYLIGAEWDINKYVQVSAGGQRTQYDLKDAVMNDISFTTSSYSFGFGVGVNVAKNVKINAAYFQTLYDGYDLTTGTAPLVKTDSFDRTNRVLGIGVDLKF